MRDLAARLFPSLNATLLTEALLAERVAGDSGTAGDDPAARERQRARRMGATGGSARTAISARMPTPRPSRT